MVTVPSLPCLIIVATFIVYWAGISKLARDLSKRYGFARIHYQGKAKEKREREITLSVSQTFVTMGACGSITLSTPRLKLTLFHSIFDVMIQYRRITITVRSLVVCHSRHSSLVVLNVNLQRKPTDAQDCPIWPGPESCSDHPPIALANFPDPSYILSHNEP